jgi:parallel beta-helix repeat protein
MLPVRRIVLILAIMWVALAAPMMALPTYAAGVSYYVNPQGSDSNRGTSPDAPLKTIQQALRLAQPGDVITLAPGDYFQDVTTERNGLREAPITITGPANAVLKGAGNGRIFQVNHDYLTLNGFTIDGLHGNAGARDGYRDKLLYALGTEQRAGVIGMRVLNMTFKNAGGECVRLRYFAQQNEIANSTFQNCGVHDYRFSAGGKNGEGIYIGTAPEQLGDGKNPTTDPDQSNGNWIHHNTFNTQGNECVDIKEASSGNIVEHNMCTGQKDPESAGFDSRGNGNTFRYNTSYGNLGAGVRLGGDTSSDGQNNDVYGNTIRDNKAGGIKFQRTPQRTICGNTMSGNSGGDAVGSYADSYNPTSACQNTPAPPAVVPTSTAVPPTAVPPTAVPPVAPPASSPANCVYLPYVVDGAAASFIEAEQYGSVSGSFQQLVDGSRSGGVAMMIPGSGMRKDPNTALTYTIDVRNGGTFYVWLLGYGRDGATDSFFVKVDDKSPIDAVLTQGKWGWKKISSPVSLANGLHTLQVTNREDGAHVDKILLTRDKGYTPSNLGMTALAPLCS